MRTTIERILLLFLLAFATGPPAANAETVNSVPRSVSPPVSSPALVADARLGPASEIGSSRQLGGFSGLVSLDPGGTRFATVTDRGPNADSGSGKDKILLFPQPTYSPSIVQLELRDGHLTEMQRIPLHLPGGYTDPRTGSASVTGLPNSLSADPPAYDARGQKRLGTDPYGLDTEGIALDPRDGSYWLCDEYGPSILHVAADGTLLSRLLPRGAKTKQPGLEVRDILPGELARRQPNHGFEGIALSPDATRLFAIMQSPLSDPDKDTGEGSRSLRLVTLDLTAGAPRVDGMYVYRSEPSGAVGAARQEDVKVGDLAALSSGRALVAERDSSDGGGFKMIYRVELAGATNILGRTDFGGRTLEQLEDGDLGRLGVLPLSKTPVVNVADLGWRHEKLEGLAIVDESTIAIVDDNDFGIAGFDHGRAQPNGVPTRLSVFRLPGSLAP